MSVIKTRLRKVSHSFV